MNFIVFKSKVYSLIAYELNTRKIKHSATHGITYDPLSIGRDLDILINYRDRKIVLDVIIKVFNSNSIAFKVIKNLWAYWIIGFKKIDGRIYDIEIDIFWSILYWGIELTDKNKLSYNINNKFEFYTEPFNAFAKSFLIQFFSKRYLKINAIKKSEISHLCDLLMKLDFNLYNYFDYDNFIRILKVAMEFDHNKLKELRNEIKTSYYFLRNPIKYLYNLTIFITWKIQEKIFYNKLPYFSFSGPDGVGKSTYINELKNEASNFIFTGITLKHWRPNLFPNIANLLKFNFDDIKKPYHVKNLMPRKNAGAWGIIRIFYYTLDYIFGYFFLDRKERKALNLLVYDRHFIDMIIHPERFGIKSFYRPLLKIILYMIPKPNYMFFLLDNAENISKRKNELSNEEIDSQIKVMMKIKMLNKRIIIIKVSTIDETTNEILKTIYDRIIK